MDTLRLFIAVPITDATIVSNLIAFQETFAVPGVRQVKPDLFHFSLHFLGDTDQSLLNDLQSIITSVSAEKFTVTLSGCGVFPGLQNIKVIWAGVTVGVQQLITIQQQLSKPLEEVGFQLDQRPFSPHLTLGRVKFLKPDGKKTIQQTIKDHKTKLFGSQEVTSVHLMQSTLTPKGSIYSSLFQKDLD